MIIPSNDYEDEINMPDTVFCYACRKHHPREEVIQVESKGVKRWRCRRSIVESRKSREQRDAFGRAVTELNQALNPHGATHRLPRPVLELFGTRSASWPLGGGF